jgi:GAF domain-containing protein
MLFSIKCCNHEYSKRERVRDLIEVLDSCLNGPINIFILGTAIINTYKIITDCDRCMIYIHRSTSEGSFLEPFAIGPEDDISIPNSQGSLEWVSTFNSFIKAAISEKKIAISNHIDLHQPYRPKVFSTRYNYAAIPLIFNDERVGIVGFVKKGKGFSNENFMQVTEILNGKLANVLHKYRKMTSAI